MDMILGRGAYSEEAKHKFVALLLHPLEFGKRLERLDGERFRLRLVVD